MQRHPRHQTKLHGHHDSKIDRTRRRRYYLCVQGRLSSFSFPDNVHPRQNCATVRGRWWRVHLRVCTTNRTVLRAHLDCRRATLEAPIARDRNITVRWEQRSRSHPRLYRHRPPGETEETHTPVLAHINMEKQFEGGDCVPTSIAGIATRDFATTSFVETHCQTKRTLSEEKVSIRR